MARYELPEGLSPDEERAVIAALERAFEIGRTRPSAWALAGRVDNLRLGALQARHQAGYPWGWRGDTPFAERGAPWLKGRGDAR